MGRVKQNSSLEHAQNVPIKISLHMRKTSSAYLLPIETYCIVSNKSVCGQRRPWSDFADTQADLCNHCPHIPEDTFFTWHGPCGSVHAQRLIRIKGVSIWLVDILQWHLLVHTELSMCGSKSMNEESSDFRWLKLIYCPNKPQSEKTYPMAYAPSEVLDQSVHSVHEVSAHCIFQCIILHWFCKLAGMTLIKLPENSLCRIYDKVPFPS